MHRSSQSAAANRSRSPCRKGTCRWGCPLSAISGHSLLPYSAIIGAEPSQLDTGRLAGLDVRISAWTSRSGDHLLFMARLWVWGFRVNVLIPDRRGLDHALTLGWRLSRLLLLICSRWVLSLRNGLLGRIVGRSGKGSSKTEAGSEEDQCYAYCCTHEKSKHGISPGGFYSRNSASPTLVPLLSGTVRPIITLSIRSGCDGGISKSAFGGRFMSTRLARAGRSISRQRPHSSPWRREAGVAWSELR